jgi:vacuolar-type H+-ATPase subunit H
MTAVGEDKAAAAAINRVLEAERRARDNVARCQAAAAARISAARAQARRVVERTDARMSALRKRVERTVAERVAALRADAAEVHCLPLVEDARRAQLEAAIARVVARLGGESP